MLLVAGTVLLGLTYVLVEQSLNDRMAPPERLLIGDPARATGSSAETPVNTPSGTPGSPAPEPAAGPDGTYTRVLSPDLVRRIQDGVAADQEAFRRETLNSLLGYGAMALGVVALAAVGFGWLMAERVLRPLHRITETATRIGTGPQGGLHERIALAGPRDEITELADTVDAMLDRLHRAFDGQRRFVANASHELRTPLAINRALLEVAVTRPGASGEVRQLGGTLLAVTERHERLVDGLLTLARSEHEPPERVPVDLADVAEYVVDALPADTAVPVRLSTRPAPVLGDPVLLAQLVANLVTNAVRHNVERGGWVDVATGPGPELVVTNTGPPVPAYECEAIFEPFRRLRDDRLAVASDGSPAGVGLGLSIVRAVARAHGGDAHATPRAGGGLAVRVVLPSPVPAGR
ncbi:MAG TPA: HAMP domain-containing sensor histidine kinase [Pseudonocardiaceae bacterium]